MLLRSPALGLTAIALTLGLNAAASPSSRSAAARKLEPELVTALQKGEAEFLVVLEEQADLSLASALRTKAEKGQYVADRLRAAAQKQTPILSMLRGRGIEARPLRIVNAILVRGTSALAHELALRPDVARLEADRVFLTSREAIRPDSAAATSSKGGGTSGAGPSPRVVEPNIAYIGAPDAWALGVLGQGVVIGSIDTGVAWDHPALKGRYRGWDGSTATHDYNWHDSVHTAGGPCPNDATVPCDDTGRGTLTMGIAVGSDGANEIGVAPGASWIACRATINGVGSASRYLECLDFMVAPWHLTGYNALGIPSLAPDIVLMPFTCPSGEGCAPLTLRNGVEALRAAGILPVAAAGDTGPSCSSTSGSPGIYASSLTVGALETGTDNLWGASSRGPVLIDFSGRRKPDLTAPGTSIRSSTSNGVYGTAVGGTAYAAAHVAGAAALVWSARPELRGAIDQALKILTDSAFDVPSTDCASLEIVPNHLFGWGRLDAKAAVDLATTRPVITKLTPNGGSPTGGTPVVIEGANFGPGAQVTFGGQSASDVVVDPSGQLITCVTPGPLFGAMDVSVIQDTLIGTLPGGFTYCDSTVVATYSGAACTGEDLQLFATFIPGATYQWIGPRAFTSADRTPILGNAFPYQSGTYTVFAITGQCQTAASSVEVSITTDTQGPVVTPPNPATLTVTQSTCGPSGTDAGMTLATLLSLYPLEANALTAYLQTSATAVDNCSTPNALASLVNGASFQSSTFVPFGTSSVTFRYQDSSQNVGTAFGSLVVRRQGDLDSDLDVDIVDNQLLQSFLVGNLLPGVPPFTSTASVMDTDGNATIDIFDVVNQAGFIVGNVPCLTP